MKRYILHNSDEFDDYQLNQFSNAIDFFTKKAFENKKHCKVNVYDPNLVLIYNDNIIRSKSYYIVVSDCVNVPDEFDMFDYDNHNHNNYNDINDDCILCKRFPTLKYETKNTPYFHDITHKFKKI